MAGFEVICSPAHLGITEVLANSKGIVTCHAHATANQPLDDLIIEYWLQRGSYSAWECKEFERVTTNPKGATYKIQIKVSKSQQIDFKVRYKYKNDLDWQWLSQNKEDGKIILSSESPLFKNISISDIFEDQDKAIQAHEVNSNVQNTQVIHLSTKVLNRKRELTSVSLGKPAGIVHWISLERLMAFWMEPNQGRNILNTPRDSFFVAFQRKEDGTHVVLLPISGLKDDCSVVVKTDEKSGELIMHTRNDGQREGAGRIILGRGTTLAGAIDAVFASARTLFQEDALSTDPNYVYEDKQFEATWFEDWTDGLFYCTWNAMYTDVTEQKILDALEGLDRQGIRVNGVIIDDGWQDIDDERRWQSFEPIKSKFPNGLKGTVDTLKKRYPYIRHVGVWHALLGYWNAMSPDSWISRNYSMIPLNMGKVNVPKGLERIHTVSPDDADRMYDDFYKYLSREGITVVKCDVEGVVDDVSPAHPDQRRIWRAYQDAFKAASDRYFSRRVIYCMSHVSNIFLHSQLQRNSFPACVRNSNDFFPDDPDSHAWHVFWNATNDLYTSRLNVLPDWDMFDTAHETAELHAMSRSLSGGLILITDQTNKSDAALIAKMTSKSIRNNETKVLRFQLPAESRYPYLNINDGRFTKVINKTYDIVTLAAFNTTKEAATESISLADFGEKLAKTKYAVYEQCSNSVQLASVEDLYAIAFAPKLKENGCAIYVASPLLTFTDTDRNATAHTQVAVLGLVDKFAGSVAVSNYRLLPSTHASLSVKLCHLGLLGIYMSFKPNLERMLVTMADIVVPAATVSHKGQVLVIDTEMAWREMEVHEYWSNEVTVEIYFRD